MVFNSVNSVVSFYIKVSFYGKQVIKHLTDELQTKYKHVYTINVLHNDESIYSYNKKDLKIRSEQLGQ